MAIVDLGMLNYDDSIDISRCTVDAEADLASSSSMGDHAGKDERPATSQSQGTKIEERKDQHCESMPSSWHEQDDVGHVVNDRTCFALAGIQNLSVG